MCPPCCWTTHSENVLWKKFENRSTFDEVKAYKTKCASFWGHPVWRWLTCSWRQMRLVRCCHRRRQTLEDAGRHPFVHCSCRIDLPSDPRPRPERTAPPPGSSRLLSSTRISPTQTFRTASSSVAVCGRNFTLIYFNLFYSFISGSLARMQYSKTYNTHAQTHTHTRTHTHTQDKNGKGENN